MILSQLLTPIVVPPVNLAALALLFTWLRARRAAGALLVVLLLLSLPIVPDTLKRGLEQGLPPTIDTKGAQAILILGGDMDRDASGRAVPGPLTLERLREGVALAHATGLPLAVTGGALWTDGPAVGTIMAESLRDDFSMPPRWVETQSVDTWENARDSAALLLPDGIHDVLIVTQSWHMARSLLAFRDVGLQARPAPVIRTGYPDNWIGMLVPSARAWHESYFALHEWIGLAWYALRARYEHQTDRRIATDTGLR